MDIIDVFLLSLILIIVIAFAQDIDWLSNSAMAFLLFIYFYPVIRTWF